MNENLPPLYALMVTGKTAKRIEWAKIQVERFMRQNYSGEKYILIANEHPALRVITKKLLSKYQKNITEILVTDRSTTTLGNIRNRLLDKVPSDSWIFILDDDDYLASDLMEEMVKFWSSDMQKSGVITCMVQFTNRLNYNLSTGNGWRSTHPSGFVHFVGDINRLREQNFRYLNRDSLEDLSIHDLKHRSLWHQNPHRLYVRYIHEDNTSLYVRKDQKEANPALGETPATSTELCLCRQGFHDQVTRTYFRQLLLVILTLILTVILLGIYHSRNQ